MTSGGRAEGAALLGLSPTLVAHHDYAVVEPPPAGAKRVLIVDDVPGRTVVDHVEIELAPPALTLADLEVKFGAGKPSVRVSAASAFKRSYQLAVPGAPNTCELYAAFAASPTSATPATTITLRRNPRR
jgi:hypothetical protein